MNTDTDQEAFREQCRRQMERPIEDRMRFGFRRVHRPIMDDEPVRVFDSTEEYRRWCAENLPSYLGYGPE